MSRIGTKVTSDFRNKNSALVIIRDHILTRKIVQLHGLRVSCVPI